MIPFAPGFFAGPKGGDVYWPYIRDVLIPDGKAVAHFDMGKRNPYNSPVNLLELRYNEYPPVGPTPPGNPTTQPLPNATYNVSGAAACSISETDGPIAERGYIESTSSTEDSRFAYLNPQYTSGYVPECFWIACAFWPTDPQVSNGGVHSILDWGEYYASATNRFPFRLGHLAGSTNLIVQVDRGNDYNVDLVVTTPGVLVLGAWNHIIVKVAKVADGGEVSLWLNGTKSTGTRLYSFPAAGTGPNAFRWSLLASYGYSGGYGKHRALGKLAEITISDTSTGATSANLITDAQATALYNAFVASLS